MRFDDFESQPRQTVSPTILWEYDLNSPERDWNKMATTVVQRVIRYGLTSDYYAILQMYGGYKGCGEILKHITSLPQKTLLQNNGNKL
ncbi:hypothetical protein PRBRB14_26730 [Hallella multisaccharivorax DSM 17128]|uniref:DUF6922 domain-containing protein n=1 Tax=Hallella multisaccharivorax DSM 17128 TaxID=688246 RepID=F8NCS6_9BACT|nr:hypothetical protein Premu_2762 [Hallella multisaccharivorax DSM 17128]GJG31794.1 hypothetical protein PRBRB14_26730 [Hallella multisaccharivorax DSM 17128]